MADKTEKTPKTTARKPTPRTPARAKSGTAAAGAKRKKAPAAKPRGSSAGKRSAAAKTAAPKSATAATNTPSKTAAKASAAPPRPQESGGGAQAASRTPDASAAGGTGLDRLWRFLGIIGFGVVSGFVLAIAFGVALLQFVVLLVRGHPNETLTRFNRHLAAYLGQIVDYFGGDAATEHMPFPFSDFPEGSKTGGD